MDFSQEELAQILKIFKDETEEHLAIVDKCLLELEKCPDDLSIIEELFREAHSIKGSARMLNIVSVQDVAHKMEDLLGLAKDGTILINSDIIDILYQTADYIGETVRQLEVENLEANNETSQKMVDKISKLQDELLTNKKKDENNQNNTKNESKPQKKTNSSQTKAISTVDVINRTFELLPELVQAFQQKNINNFLEQLYIIANIISTLNHKNISFQVLTLINTAENFGKNNTNDNDILAELDTQLSDFVSTINNLASNFGISPLKIFSNSKETNKQKNKLFKDKNENEKFSQIEIIFHYLNYVDNKFQNEKATTEICNVLKNLLSKELQGEIYDTVQIIYENFEYIKQQHIIPSKETVESFKDVLHVVFAKLKNENTNENLELVKQKLNVIKQMLEIQQSMPEINKNEANELIDFAEKNAENLPVAKPIKQFQEHTLESFENQSFKTLRVDTQKLDKLENQVEELIVVKIKNKQHMSDLNDIMRKISDIQKDVNKSHTYLKYLDRKSFSSMMNVEKFSAFRNFQIHLEKINTKVHDVSLDIIEFQKRLVNDDVRLNFLVDAIETMVKSVRVLPLATIFHMFPRMVRDIARQKGKQVDIIILGSETSADKTIIEEIKAPLMHIIRNSIDHGIEPPDERIRLGKNPTGKIILNSYCMDNAIVIDISDDGQGIDIEKIKQKILDKKLLTIDELEQLTKTQIMNIIFWPGFSTGDKVTDISGRGVGLDVVHTKISQLDGKVSIKSKQGEGFKITIKIPITLATLNSFIFKIAGQNYAIASAYVKTAIRINDDKIFTKEGKPHILFNNNSIRLINMASMFNFESSKHDVNQHYVLIVQVEDTAVALEVDEFVRTEEILQKKLNPPFTKFKNIMGIASLSNGESCLILNVNDIINSAISNYQIPQNKEAMISVEGRLNKRPSILIVDDSMTTITLERNILRTAGYNIFQATNGDEAYLILRKEKIDLLVTDIEMPELNGLELIQKMKKDNINIPVIVLTSLQDEKKKSLCIDEGARVLISKKDFDENEFLDTIEQLLREVE